jgi:hypothetical protein
MHWQSKPNVVFSICVIIAVASMLGCDRIGGRSIMVEFRNAEGIRGGEAVYIAGVRVGTTGEPSLANGKARIPVTLGRKHKDAVPAGAVFLIKADPTDARKFSLGATTCVGGPPSQTPPEIFRGANSRLELVAMCGLDAAKQLFQEFSK